MLQGLALKELLSGKVPKELLSGKDCLSLYILVIHFILEVFEIKYTLFVQQ